MKNKIWTPFGAYSGSESDINCKIGKNEIEIDPNTQSVTRVKDGTVGVDNQDGNVSNDTIILGNVYNEQLGTTPAEYGR